MIDICIGGYIIYHKRLERMLAIMVKKAIKAKKQRPDKRKLALAYIILKQSEGMRIFYHELFNKTFVYHLSSPTLIDFTHKIYESLITHNNVTEAKRVIEEFNKKLMEDILHFNKRICISDFVENVFDDLDL